MMEMDYEELSRMIDLKIAASFERLLSDPKFFNYEWQATVSAEVEWLRMP